MLRPLYFMEQVDRGYLVPGDDNKNNKLLFTVNRHATFIHF